MAEGWARSLFGDSVEVYSAGTEPHGLNPRAVKAMAEAGIDISGHTSDHVDRYESMTMDLVVTVCDSAREACPTFPNARRLVHHSFDDPPKLAASASSDDEAMQPYRRVRDEIRAFVESLRGSLVDTGTASPR